MIALGELGYSQGLMKLGEIIRIIGEVLVLAGEVLVSGGYSCTA